MQIKTYKGKRIEKPFFFFILNKGNNSGKPLTQSCANCYLLIAETQHERDFYYWLCYGLWQSNKFHPFLSGSVIPFLRVHELKEVIRKAEQKIKAKPEKFDKALKALIQVNEYFDDIQKQMQFLKQAKKALMNEALK